ncbi:MAG: GNAT family N-acetyltransferase [Marinobacter sp.]|uniref:GNAT family N-acetyltransferase n=1 Tax=Marinobacter sp. TaxID=50741 RepID=UPI00396DEECF
MNHGDKVCADNNGSSEPVSLIEKVARRYRSDGLSGVSWIAVKRLTCRWPVLFFYTFTAPNATLTNIRANNRFEFEVSSEVPCEKHLNQLGRTRVLFDRRLGQGHRYVIAFDGDNAVGLLWAHDGDVHFEQQYGFNVPFGRDQLFYYDSLTLPEWRCQGVLQGMLGALAKHTIQQDGKAELAAIIETSNLGSRRAHEKLGFSKRQLNMYCGALSRYRPFVLWRRK